MSRIILAMKNFTSDEAVYWARKLKHKVWGYKLNSMLYNNLDLIRRLKEYGNVMADPKVFEVPEDMLNTVSLISKYGADIITVHASAFWKPPEEYLDKLAAVTVLTSFTDGMCLSVYGSPVKIQVPHLAEAVAKFGYRMIVCSAEDLRNDKLKNIINSYNLKVICPSIRLNEQEIINDDQARKCTPVEAVKLGAQYLVIGRPILQAKSPIDLIDKINDDIIKNV